MEIMGKYLKTGNVVQLKSCNSLIYGIIIDNIVMYIEFVSGKRAIIAVRGYDLLKNVVDDILKIWDLHASISDITSRTEVSRPTVNEDILKDVIQGRIQHAWERPSTVELTIATIEEKLKEGGFIGKHTSLKIIKEVYNGTNA